MSKKRPQENDEVKMQVSILVLRQDIVVAVQTLGSEYID